MLTALICGCASEAPGSKAPAAPRTPLIASSEVVNEMPGADPGWRSGTLNLTVGRAAELSELLAAIAQGRVRVWCPSGQFSFTPASGEKLQRRYEPGDKPSFSLECQQRLPGLMEIPEGQSPNQFMMDSLTTAQPGSELERSVWQENQPFDKPSEAFETVEKAVGKAVIRQSMMHCGERGVILRHVLTSTHYDTPATADEPATDGLVSWGMVLDCADQTAPGEGDRDVSGSAGQDALDGSNSAAAHG